MNWDYLVDSVTPYILKIETPTGYGTGFICMYNENKVVCGAATAHHVVEYADKWEQPIRLILHSGESVLLKQPDYIIFSNRKTDSAVILFPALSLKLMGRVLELIPPGIPLNVGSEVAWLGYPIIEPNTLCFFFGSISAWQDYRKAYLIDGVAINGVSGGPVMCRFADGTYKAVGIVTSYIANRATGETLPGLLYAQDVSHFEKVIASIRNIDEAIKKKQESEREQSATVQPENVAEKAPAASAQPDEK